MRFLGVVMLIIAALGIGCGASDGQDYSDRCIRLVIERADEIAQEHGQVNGGIAMIPAQYEIAREHDECAWVDEQYREQHGG